MYLIIFNGQIACCATADENPHSASHTLIANCTQQSCSCVLKMISCIFLPIIFVATTPSAYNTCTLPYLFKSLHINYCGQVKLLCFKTLYRVTFINFCEHNYCRTANYSSLSGMCFNTNHKMLYHSHYLLQIKPRTVYALFIPVCYKIVTV